VVWEAIAASAAKAAGGTHQRAGLHSITAEDSLLTLMFFLFQLFVVSLLGTTL
jgi:hypothetical protein